MGLRKVCQQPVRAGGARQRDCRLADRLLEDTVEAISRQLFDEADAEQRLYLGELLRVEDAIAPRAVQVDEIKTVAGVAGTDGIASEQNLFARRERCHDARVQARLRVRDLAVHERGRDEDAHAASDDRLSAQRRFGLDDGAMEAGLVHQVVPETQRRRPSHDPVAQTGPLGLEAPGEIGLMEGAPVHGCRPGTF